MQHKIKTPIFCNGCDFKCKIDAIPSQGGFGVMQRYYPVIADTTQYTYQHNHKTKETPFLKSKTDAIKHGLKIAKLCEFNTKNR